MNIFKFLRLLLFNIYGVISNVWFGWTVVSPEFWIVLIIMVLAGLFAWLERNAYDR